MFRDVAEAGVRNGLGCEREETGERRDRREGEEPRMWKKDGTGMRTAAEKAAMLAMLLVVTAMLLTSFQIAIYADPDYRFYEKEYEKYKVTVSLGMKMEDVMEVTDYMMDYLIGRENELSVVTVVDGERQDFFNEQDRLHMEDVRNLFLGGLRFRTECLTLAAFLVLGLLIGKEDWRNLLPKAYFRVLLALAGMIVLLTAAFSIDFTRCFTIFHEIFFTNDLWMFDPSEDYMIRMLPEGFFSDMLARIGMTFVGMLLALGAVFLVMQKRGSQ